MKSSVSIGSFEFPKSNIFKESVSWKVTVPKKEKGLSKCRKPFFMRFLN